MVFLPFRSLAACSLAAAVSALALAGPLDSLAAQQGVPDPSEGAVGPLATWVRLGAPTGHEARAFEMVREALPQWEPDQAGNLVRVVGAGSPRRVVACGIDRAGYVVSQITSDGYLRLKALGRGPRHPLRDQWHQGQRVRVLTRAAARAGSREGSRAGPPNTSRAGPRSGPGNQGVPGVAAVGNAHFSSNRIAPDTAIIDVNRLWLDVGARTRDEAEAMGIQLLDPVIRELPPWGYAGYVAGPEAATRVGCAAVGAAAAGEVERGETIFLLTTQRGFGHAGLHAALARLGPVDEVTLMDAQLAGAPAPPEENAGPQVRERMIAAGSLLPASSGVDSVRVLAPAARFPGTPVESVHGEAADAVLTAVAHAAGLSESTGGADLDWIALPGDEAPDPYPLDDDLAETAELLGRLADLPGVSGHEHQARQAVLDALPRWARERAEVDTEGNVVLAMGPARDTAVFVAHLDETGWEVGEIRANGTVELRRRGGMMPVLWEARPALLHFDPEEGAPAADPLPGIFLPRDEVHGKQPATLEAWFGMDAETLAERGVREGLSITAWKQASRLGAVRFTARALDDRTGTLALIRALERIDPDALPRAVVFAWSVREEVGLEGARALAERLGPTVRRAYSVDTFVSSDTPVETPHFAHAPLGHGPVLRGLDNAGVTPPTELDRIRQIAAASDIPLQVGTTDGGVDGTVFVPWGAVHAGLSWPGRYSHSPVEVLDLRDLEELVRLIVAVAETPVAETPGGNPR